MAKRASPTNDTLAGRFGALGGEPRLRIVRVLLAAYPDGVVVSDIQAKTGIAGATLSHHLEKLRHTDLVIAQREKAFFRYRINIRALEELLTFLYGECCTRNHVVDPTRVISS